MLATIVNVISIISVTCSGGTCVESSGATYSIPEKRMECVATDSAKATLVKLEGGSYLVEENGVTHIAKTPYVKRGNFVGYLETKGNEELRITIGEGKMWVTRISGGLSLVDAYECSEP